MQAVILAGGLGTRLRPLTLTMPKPLVPVANVPIVRRIVDKLPPEVTKVVLAVNYKVEALAAYFANEDVGREIVLVEEKEPLGTAGALKNVESEIDGTFLAFNGDVLDSLDVARFLAFHREKGATATMSLWKVRDPRHFGVVAMTGSRISRFVEKPASKNEAPSFLANAGTYALEPEIFDHIEGGVPASLEREVFPALIAAGRGVHGFPFTGYWVDVGRPETYLKANETILRADKRKIALGPGVRDDGAEFDDWAVVGANGALGAGAEIQRSVLLDGVTVGKDAAVKESVIGPGARIEEDAVVVDSVLGAEAVVKRGVLVKNAHVEPREVIGDAGG